jgi:hypothetical protein
LVQDVRTEDRANLGRQKRSSERVALVLPARLTWKDHEGATRFASVVTCNVSDFGVYVESSSPLSIPLYRLVRFQLERDVRGVKGLPMSLRDGRALSAVYRIVLPANSGGRYGFALRLMVDPKRFAQDSATDFPSFSNTSPARAS